MTEQAPPGLAQVGPRYGVRDFIRSIEMSWRGGMSDAPWIMSAQAALKTRVRIRTAAEFIVNDILSGAAGQALMSYEMREGRRLGKPFVQIDSQIGQPAVLELDEREDEAIVLQDCVIRVEGDRTIGTFSPGRFLVTRHALERLYEREGVPTGGMPNAIRHTVADVRRSIAFATVAGLFLGEVPDPNLLTGDSGTAIGAVQLVPCSTGLLVVEVLLSISLKDDYPIVRLETRRSGTFGRASPICDPMFVDVVRNGVTAQVAPMHMGRTYLSSDILRPEQLEYARLFRSTQAQVDLASIARHVFGTRDMHMVDVHAEIPDLPDVARLRDLLPQCVVRSENNLGVWRVRPGRISEDMPTYSVEQDMTGKPKARRPRRLSGLTRPGR